MIETTTAQTAEAAAHGAQVIDVREDFEVAGGMMQWQAEGRRIEIPA